MAGGSCGVGISLIIGFTTDATIPAIAPITSTKEAFSSLLSAIL